MVYLAPFLTLIRAPDVSGPVTGAAAVALYKIICSELMCRSGSLRVPAHANHACIQNSMPTLGSALHAAVNTYNMGPAINQIVADATQSKFESTDNGQDEIVLLNVVRVRE